MEERLQKLLSQWGVASRRQAEKLIEDGRVRVNGAIAHLGQKAHPTLDVIELDGVVLSSQDRPDLIYVLVNKPLGIVSTCDDPWGRQTVLDLLPSELRQGRGIHPVGRLDADSTGALLLTNDGQLTYELTHPRHEIAKTYHVLVRGKPSLAALTDWQQGILLDDHLTLPAQVTVLDIPHRTQTWLEVVLWEGRNRQIRRVADYLGHPVLKLHRVAIGSLTLDNLAVGHYRLIPHTDLLTHLKPEQSVLIPDHRSNIAKDTYWRQGSIV